MNDVLLLIFNELCSVPHPSFLQEPMKQLLVRILDQNGIACQTDSAHNILATIKASPGFENRQPVCLQAHYDMVFVSNKDQDKLTALVETKIEDGYLRAVSSSLGADNCAALASILALVIRQLNNTTLDNKYYYLDHPHGPIELLFTADEEVSLLGAKNMTLQMQSKYLINTDCEDHHHIINGSAGGNLTTYVKKPIMDILPQESFSIDVKLSNFFGGHTGFDLGKQRTNITKLLLKILQQLPDSYITKLTVGQAINSMPFEAELELVVTLDMLLQAQEIILETYNVFTQFTADKGHLQVISDKHSYYQAVKTSSLLFLNAIELEENFIDQTSKIPVLSSFITMITVNDQIVKISVFNRSLSNLGLTYLSRVQQSLFKDFKIETSDLFAVWQVCDNKMLQAAKQVYGEDCKVHPIHACYETSYLTQNQVQAIAIGPEIHNPHSVNEELDIKSWHQFTIDLPLILDRFWREE